MNIFFIYLIDDLNMFVDILVRKLFYKWKDFNIDRLWVLY